MLSIEVRLIKEQTLSFSFAAVSAGLQNGWTEGCWIHGLGGIDSSYPTHQFIIDSSKTYLLLQLVSVATELLTFGLASKRLKVQAFHQSLMIFLQIYAFKSIIIDALR